MCEIIGGLPSNYEGEVYNGEIVYSYSVNENYSEWNRNYTAMAGVNNVTPTSVSIYYGSNKNGDDNYSSRTYDLNYYNIYGQYRSYKRYYNTGSATISSGQDNTINYLEVQGSEYVGESMPVRYSSVPSTETKFDVVTFTVICGPQSNRFDVPSNTLSTSTVGRTVFFSSDGGTTVYNAYINIGYY